MESSEEKPRQSSDDVRQRSTRYPRHDLKRAEEFARVVFEEGPRYCDIDRIAQAAGYKSSQNGAFSALRSSTVAFGLIQNDRNGTISVTENWIEAFHSEDDQILRRQRQQAALSPALYQMIFQEFENRQLPAQERLARTLHVNTKYGILKDAATLAAQVFIESVEYAGLLDSKGFLRQPSQSNNAITAEAKVEELSYDSQRSEVYLHPTPGVSTAFFNYNLGVPDDDNLDRIVINLRSGSKAYLFVPVPLPYGEKERIKKYIDLLLEEDPTLVRGASDE